MKACPGGCDHAAVEHEAFDSGVAQGERGANESSQPPYRAPALREAWRTGVAVGVLNRKAR